MGTDARFDHPRGSIVVSGTEDYSSESRPVYCYAIRPVDGPEHSATDLSGGCGDVHDPNAGLRSLASFVGAFVEAIRYADYTGREPSDNVNLFPRELADFLSDIDDELYMATHYDADGNEIID